MTKSSVKSKLRGQNNLDIFKDYPWFYKNVFEAFLQCSEKFFQYKFDLRFIGVSRDDNMLFYGDEYFVNNIAINKTANFKIKLSSGVVEYLLDVALGRSSSKFNIQTITDIESMLIKSYSVFIYNNIQKAINKIELSKQAAQEANNLNLMFFVRKNNIHIGKILITLPEYMIPEIEADKLPETFSISDFKDINTNLTVGIGKTKLTLNEVKSIDDGDIILLEESNIKKFFINFDDYEISFNIKPNPSLVIKIDSNGGKEMDETTENSQNMWDSIIVDVVAEFDNVKLTLGELKQISEGLVIDVGSVYDSKVKLRVKNQVVASGELVILNDRYGVRVEKVQQINEDNKTLPPPKQISGSAQVAQVPNQVPGKQTRQPMPANPNAPIKEGDENFDYSDFEIEDESI